MNKRPALFIAALAAAVAVLSFAFFQRDSGPSCAYTSEKAVLPDFSGVIEKVMPRSSRSRTRAWRGIRAL